MIHQSAARHVKSSAKKQQGAIASNGLQIESNSGVSGPRKGPSGGFCPSELQRAQVPLRLENLILSASYAAVFGFEKL